MALPIDKFGQVGAVTSKIFMKGKAFGTFPGAGSAFNFDINFDTIYADAVHLEGYANFIDTFSKITTIETKVGLINAKTEHLSVGSVDNMTVYYQSDGDSDEIVLVNRIINKNRQMWLQGVQGFGPLQDNLSAKIWADKPADIATSASNSEYIKQQIDIANTANHLKNDWLYKHYSPEGATLMENSSCYHAIYGLGNLGRALANTADEVAFDNYWAPNIGPSRVETYSVGGFTKAVKKILTFEEKIDAIKAKTDKIPDDLLTRLQSIATDASGANVKSGSAEREAKAAHDLLKNEILPKVKDCISRVRSSSAWVLNCICRIVKACWAPFKECLKQDGTLDVISDTTTAYDYIYNGPNFGISGNMQGENPPGYTFACTTIDRPVPYWPLSVTNADATNFRSVIQDLPQAVSAYYWPSAYESRD